MLDIPEPSYVSIVQTILAGGESWNITAPVFATVATFNHSRTKDPSAFESYFNSFCQAAAHSSGAYPHMSMMNHFSVNLVNHASPGDQSLQYVALFARPRHRAPTQMHRLFSPRQTLRYQPAVLQWHLVRLPEAAFSSSMAPATTLFFPQISSNSSPTIHYF